MEKLCIDLCKGKGGFSQAYAQREFIHHKRFNINSLEQSNDGKE